MDRGGVHRAAVSGKQQDSSICIAVVSVSGVGVIVLSEQTVVVAARPAGRVEFPGNNVNGDPVLDIPDHALHQPAGR